MEGMLFRHKQSGFTIVELLIVIVVIGILAALTIVAYNGVSRQATVSGMKSELKTAATQVNFDKVKAGSFPASLATANEGKGIVAGDKKAFQYTGTGTEFCLSVTSTEYTDLVFSINQDGVINNGACPTPPVVATNSACFAFTTGTGTITDYYDNESNNSSNPACPRAVVVPSTIGGVSVQVLGTQSFYNNQLTSVVIQSPVTSIGTSAFSFNQLTSVTLPSSITTIGNTAFNGNQLASINLPGSLTSIGTSAFSSNQLTSVVIPNSVTSMGTHVFTSNQLTSVTLSTSLTSIGINTFQNNKLTSLTIPSSVTSIGTSAFMSNELTSLTIPSSVTSIGDSSFYSNKLTSVSIANSVLSIGPSAFGNNKLPSVTIPNSVTSIGSNAFAANPAIGPSIVCNIPTGKTFTGTGCATIAYY